MPLVLIVIDEIGLAELSPYNPLKVLHSRLEPPMVAFIGISNWTLDASKMNRVLIINLIIIRLYIYLESKQIKKN